LRTVRRPQALRRPVDIRHKHERAEGRAAVQVVRRPHVPADQRVLRRPVRVLAVGGRRVQRHAEPRAQHRRRSATFGNVVGQAAIVRQAGHAGRSRRLSVYG